MVEPAAGMRTSMAAMRSLGPAVLALFLATNVVPRSVLLVHHHAGGERAHVHPFGDEGAPHVDPPAVAPIAHGLGLASPDTAGGDHVHSQHPYQLAARPPVPGLVPVATVEPLRPVPARAPALALAHPARSRAPPPARDR